VLGSARIVSSFPEGVLRHFQLLIANCAYGGSRVPSSRRPLISTKKPDRCTRESWAAGRHLLSIEPSLPKSEMVITGRLD
jgi:hypothetical protein